MKKLILMVLIILSLVFLSACENFYQTTDTIDTSETVKENATLNQEENLTQVEEEAEPEENIEEVVVEEELEVLCSDDSECEWNEYCINEKCSSLTQVYDTESDCETKCNFDNVVVTTSDDQEFTLSRGKGSYTSAGALEWKLMSSADYCQGEEDTVVAVQLLKKNLGEIVETQVITLEVGQESEVITHPNLASVEFSMTIESIDETCS